MTQVFQCLGVIGRENEAENTSEDKPLLTPIFTAIMCYLTFFSLLHFCNIALCYTGLLTMQAGWKCVLFNHLALKLGKKKGPCRSPFWVDTLCMLLEVTFWVFWYGVFMCRYLR